MLSSWSKSVALFLMCLLTTFRSAVIVSRRTPRNVARMTTCIERVRCWMASNRLRLNPTKTELILLSSSRRANLLSTSLIRLFGTVMQPSHSVRDLGVIVDSDLSLSALSCQPYHQRVLLLSARSGTRLSVALLHVTYLRPWPSSVTFS